MTAGLLDDAMWYAIFAITQTITMTAEMTVRFRAPVPVETDLVVCGRFIQQRRSLFTCAATIADSQGAILADAVGKFLRAPQSVVEELKVVID